MHESPGSRDKERGIIVALLERLNNYYLPRAIDLKQQVDRGGCLTQYDLQFLKTAISESGESRRLAKKHPQYQQLVDQMMHLYSEIASKSLVNEQSVGKGGVGQPGRG
jgi:hypothetical protein